MTFNKNENLITLEAAGQISVNSIRMEMGPKKAEKLDRRFAMMLYMRAFLFSFGKDKYLMDWIDELGTNYKLLTADNLAGYLLDECYRSVKYQISGLIALGTRFSIFVDESTNIALYCILIFILSFVFYNFFITAEDVGSTLMITETTCALILNLLMDLFNGDFSKLNAFFTDICNQMRAIWRGLVDIF